VAADSFWDGVTEGESRIRIRGDDHGMLMKILFEHVFDGPGQRRYDTGDDSAGETLRGNSCSCEQIRKEDAVLVRGFFHIRGQSPMGGQGAAVIDAPDNVGVADVYDEEHDAILTVCR